jgi:patatin-like phospholipase/acyl hydrolase
MAKKFKVLSIDGGGLRGIVPLLILKKIEELEKKKIHELFDLIVGTSTGGIIACGLTATKDGITPILSIDDLIDLYTTKGNVIFPQNKGFVDKLTNKISSIFNPKYSANGLDKLLTDYFGDITLNQTLKPIIVTSYDLKQNEVLMFKSRKSNEEGFNAKLKDICRATSAAPTYLPSYSMAYGNAERVCIDGGVYINNPTMAAISDIIRNKYNNPELKLEDITCLSLGTGTYTKNLGVKDTTKWGVIEWARPITNVMMQASSKSVVYESNELLTNYLRLDISIDDKDKSDMADSRPETTKYITNIVNNDILNSKNELKNIKNFFKISKTK